MRSERGQALPLVLLLVTALLVGAFLLLAAVTADLNDRSRAQTAADAAALAGASAGEAAARQAAEANKGTLESYRQFGPDALVTVKVRGEMATARGRGGNPAVS